MEEIRRAAGAYYENLPDEEKRNARFSFNEMDKNKDGKINLDEYVEYLKKDNNTVLPSLFTALDKDGNGTLDFDEAIVLYYTMQSGRAIICQSCKTFLAGAYFTCSQCFFNDDDSVSTFDVCCDCYGGKKFRHNDGHIFCDNYTLLRQSRSPIQAAPIKKRTKVLNILKRGMQVAGITSSDLQPSNIGGIITGDDEVRGNGCSIM
ncbi:hypothetical protein POPTR_019G028800v4 [Populus trichocarpa]|uniref:EF-hand domain-containing protein n=1 Tax=Populus trichocarpa TaxID=3694 RepID=A0A2K1WNK8_POPTR|nr:hypothetical protein POPTR_019G028800v4 [Populus trichocarpa]|eukprot:XP_006388950.2 uncharacterized protein LOC18110625 [Populus trichocarpa]